MAPAAQSCHHVVEPLSLRDARLSVRGRGGGGEEGGRERERYMCTCREGEGEESKKKEGERQNLMTYITHCVATNVLLFTLMAI